VRVAFAGKGGAGKTTLAATTARLVARAGREVVALDADSNPNLATALGAGAIPVKPLPPALVSRRLDGGPALRERPETVIDRYGLRAPDGVVLVHMGMPEHADEGCLCAAHATVSALLEDLASAPRLVTVVDLEASPEHLSRGTARHAETLVLVGEPYYRSLEAVGRLGALAAELGIPRVGVVANKVRRAGDAEAVGEFCERHGLEYLGSVPFSDEALEADRARQALVDRAPTGAVARAVWAVARAVIPGLDGGTPDPPGASPVGRALGTVGRAD
jgi:CO dehydrogenase maturation factor